MVLFVAIRHYNVGVDFLRNKHKNKDCIENKINNIVEQLYSKYEIPNINYKNCEKYRKIQASIKNVPPCFEFTRNGIIDSVDNYIEFIELESANRNKEILKHFIIDYFEFITKIEK